MPYVPILPDPTEEHENSKKCYNWYCEKILDMNDYDDICNNCYNQVEPEEEEEETQNK